MTVAVVMTWRMTMVVVPVATRSYDDLWSQIPSQMSKFYNDNDCDSIYCLNSLMKDKWFPSQRTE